MPRRAPSLPGRSGSHLRGGPPADAAKPDEEAVADVVAGVERTGSIDATARKLALYARMTGQAAPAPGPAHGAASTTKVDDGPGAGTKPSKGPGASAFDDPEEQEYREKQAAKTKTETVANGTGNGTGTGNGNGSGYGIAEGDECAVDDGEDDPMDGSAGAGASRWRAETREAEEEEEEVVHLQEVVEGLWVGDLVAAMDTEGLQQRGITNILSLLRPRLAFDSQFAVFPLEIDDAADTDILTHLPTCVAWIGEALRRHQRQNARRRSSTSGSGSGSGSRPRRRSSLSPKTEKSLSHEAGDIARLSSPDGERDVLIRHLPQTRPGGVLVHCQAGMSRSATVVVAYLMTALQLDPQSALEMLREKRPVVDPSDTFWLQLALFYNADGRVSLRDRDTRQFYMERTTTQFMNRGGRPDVSMMAKYPATPTVSSPPTPSGSHGRRKIRCKMCRRHLAVREHMMDHILEQAPLSRPRTPSVGGGTSPGPGSGLGGVGMSRNLSMTSPLEEKELSPTGMSEGARGTTMERRPSVVSDIINPLTGLPGARSRHASMSSDRPAMRDPRSRSGSDAGSVAGVGVGGSASVPVPRSSSGFALTAIDPARASSPGPGGTGMVETPKDMTRSNSLDSSKALGLARGQQGQEVGAGVGVTSPTDISAGAGTPRRSGSIGTQGQTGGRALRSAEELASSLPPHLAALRMISSGSGGMSAGAMPGSAISSAAPSPPSSPEKETSSSFSHHQQQQQQQHATHARVQGEGAKTAARRMSMLALTPTPGLVSPGSGVGAGAGAGSGGSGDGGNTRERRGSGYGFGFGGEIAQSGPPILVNPRCSGYFVEPLTWMEPVLASGQINGKLVCPNEKCGVKIGNYDWAGVQCGCKEWVTPGFCISRSKVDEVW